MKYMLGSKKNGDLASFEYFDNGVLKSINILTQLALVQVKFITSNSTHKDDLPALLGLIQTKDKTAYIDEISQDLSFEAFWETYDHKVGKKVRVKKKWDSMSQEERAKALKHIKKYTYFLAQNPTIAKKYPETFLSAEEWNN